MARVHPIVKTGRTPLTLFRMVASSGTVYLVGAGPGDPGLLTRRGLELLRSADAVLHDELVHPALLRLVNPEALLRNVGKRGRDPHAKQLKQAQIDAMTVELARAGKSVVRLKGGDPFLFGRGSEECEALLRAGVRFEVVPGVTSPLAAAAYAGISLTHRDLASSVLFVSGTTRAGVAYDFAKLRGLGGTVCVLMGLSRLPEICAALVRDAGWSPETPAVAIQSGTLPSQRVVEATLSDLPRAVEAAALSSPVLAVLGEVAALRRELRWFDTRPLFGKRVLVARAGHQAEETEDLVRARGAEPVSVALLAVRPPADLAPARRAVAALGAYDLVVFTSQNAVSRFFALLTEVGKDARALGGARVAAIGEGTARALAARGIAPDVVPADSRGEGLAAACLADLGRTREAVGGARVLLPRALVARDVLPDTLRAAGVEVDVAPVYETVTLGRERAAELEALFAEGAVDVLLLTSNSTVTALAEALGPRLHELSERLLVASIGPVTTAAAEAAGLRVAVTSEAATLPALLDAVERTLGSA